MRGNHPETVSLLPRRPDGRIHPAHPRPSGLRPFGVGRKGQNRPAVHGEVADTATLPQEGAPAAGVTAESAR